MPLRGQGKVVSPQGASANSTNGANEAQPAGDPEPPAGAAEPASESTADGFESAASEREQLG